MKKFTIVLSIASLLSTKGLYSEGKENGREERNQAPACIALAGKNNRPAVSLDVSFLYYLIAEDGLDLANSAAVVTSGVSEGDVIAIQNSRCLTQSFKYAPGFKVGAGALWKDLDLNLEYTWLCQTTTQMKGAPSVDPSLGSGLWILNNWFQQTSTSGQPIAATSVFSHWRMNINLIDLTIKRPIYEGCSLALLPFFGVRGAIINQYLNVTIDASPYVITNLATSQSTSHNLSRSWGVGPIVGSDFYWFLPKHFRVEGEGMVCLFFTQFSAIKHSENVVSASSQPSQLSVQLSDTNCIRPQIGLSLGLGWGKYLREGKSYFDLAATYDFYLFWQQNMMRKLMDQTLAGTGAGAGDLYLQGLDITGSFYF